MEGLVECSINFGFSKKKKKKKVLAFQTFRKIFSDSALELVAFFKNLVVPIYKAILFKKMHVIQNVGHILFLTRSGI